MKILITGGARRIGKMLSEHLAEQGHEIAIHCNSSVDEAEELMNSLGGKDSGHTFLQCNLNDLADVEALLPSLIEQWGPPDAIINNASTYFRRGMSQYSNEELLDDYRINFFAPLILMREFHKLCKKGNIINFIDRRVNLIDPEAGPYALAKKSLRDATLACAEEWQGKVRINAIAPGPVLLPDEDYEDASKSDALEKIKKTVDQYLSGSSSGELQVIE